VREIRVIDGSSNVTGAVDGEISGVISGDGGINKTGDGTLLLDANNTYTGVTRISGGALRYTDSNRINGSNVELNGGVLEIGVGSFTRALGTGGNQVRWIADGGFSATGGDRTVNLHNDARTLVWASTGNFVANNQRLIFGSTSADGTVLFANNIDLNGFTRTIHVVDGSATEEVRFNGDLTNGSLLLTGNGTASLTRDDSAFAGDITVRGAEFVLRDSVNLNAMDASDTVRLEKGGRLVLDYNTAANDQGFLSDTVVVRLSGGSITSRGDADQSIAETVGALHLDAGANTLDAQRANTSFANRLTFQSLNRSASSTVDFTNSIGGGALGTSGNNPGIAFSSAPTLDDGILAYATVNGTGFATHGANGVAAAATDTGTWEANKNIGVTANGILGFDLNRQVNSVVITNGASMDFAGRNVDVQSGGLLAHGSSATIFTGGGTLTSSSGELITHVYGSGGFTIQQAVTNSGSTPVAFTKSGDGTLTFSGTAANTYTGVTTVNAGTLALAKSAGLNAIAGNLVVGDGRGVDTVRLDANDQIADTASVTLRGGELGNSANVARLEMNGAASDSFGSRVERFATLNIEGNTILDFGGGTPCSPTFLYLDFLNVASNALLTITNWIEFTDFLLVDKTTFDSEDLSRVIFDGYGGEASWKSYDSDYYQIIPYSPVPEPASYGALAVGGLLGLATFRRRRRAA
jgi:autotransporter-associated beta strand protein